MKTHALVIGGTGMLKDVSIHLCKQYKTVTVIGRNMHRFNTLLRETEHLEGNINPIVQDYTDEKLLLEKLEETIINYGKVELVVSWIHSIAPGLALKICGLVDSSNMGFRFFDILGSSYADPSKNNEIRKAEFKKLKNIKYRKVILGFVLEGNSSRWLTDEEISSGVIEAIENDSENYTVGVTEPWEARPGN